MEETIKETKYQKAFRYLLDEYYCTPKRWDDYLTLKQCVERETVVFISENTKDKYPNFDENHTYHTTYQCPCCGTTLHYNCLTYINYCSNCGQRIMRLEDNKGNKGNDTACCACPTCPTPIKEKD